ncbi:hypothetical protein [Dactylosporangium sp. NBC_01737]|uniref:hypothetical protein n=1 Tax=Dactylosporangium sp. NBC_01737 TaxID=2975959 RepID=UPI003FA38576
MTGQVGSTPQHISFLETGRSGPSRQTVLRLWSDRDGPRKPGAAASSSWRLAHNAHAAGRSYHRNRRVGPSAHRVMHDRSGRKGTPQGSRRPQWT